MARLSILFWASRALLVLGIGGWLLGLYLPPEPPDCTDPSSNCSVFDLGEQRAENFQLERIGGKAAVLAVELNRWLAVVFHGRNLVRVASTAALLLAWACRKLTLELVEDDKEAHPKALDG
jgi:hypothetical protein